MITLRVACCLTRVSLSRGKFGNDSNNDNDNDRDIDSDNNNDNRYITKLMIKIFCMMYSVYIGYMWYTDRNYESVCEKN